MSSTSLYATAAGMLAVPVLAATVFIGSGAADPPPVSGDMVCTVTTGATAGTSASPVSVINLSATQTDQARTIVGAVKALGMDQHAAVVALMVARQESGFANLANSTVPASLLLPHQGVGHNSDSLGVFQQRPSQGWGTVNQLMTPGYAATAFLRTLAGIPNWASLPAWQAGQAVQRSADGTLYRQWQPLGTALAAALFAGTTGALTCTASTLPAPNTAAAATAIAYARQQLGKPYIYGGTGPVAYDCSGLVYMAYRAAGISLPRTAEYQIDAGTPVPPDQLQPGDLVFFNLGEQIPGRPGHVGIYLGGGVMLDAPHTGAVVRIESVDRFGSYVGARRVTPPPS